MGRYPFDVVYADILDMADTHDYVEGKSGYRKLVVYVDSLSRWVEAVPCHKDPTSEQILDMFSEHVICRHGAPRRLVTDHGSNLASRTCDAVLRKTGVDLSPSSAEHHESVGVVERFNQTLVNMSRASDEGGAHWADHLPFLLMAYRATPHRVTRLSPAMVVYGREMRLPAQMGLDVPPPDAAELQEAGPDAVLAYALRLHKRLWHAWQSAHECTKEEQGKAVADTFLRARGMPRSYQVGDRVARRLPDGRNKDTNKLLYKYGGPYRVEAALGNGRYQLRDLENNHVFNEFDVSNLRPYLAVYDEEALGTDEYLVDSLLDSRTRGGQVEYLVKWRGFPRSETSWEPCTELSRRCADMIEAFEAKRLRSQSPAPAPARPAPTPPPRADRPTESTGPRPGDPVDHGPTSSREASPADEQEDGSDRPEAQSHLPYAARFEHGRWEYGRLIPSRRGAKTIYYPAANFTPDELDSDHFQALRQAADSATRADPVAAATVGPLPSNENRTPHTASSRIRRAAKVWFQRGDRVLSFFRADSPDRLNPDTFGGTMDESDETAADDLGPYVVCARRELAEEVALPSTWLAAAEEAYLASPRGHHLLTLHQASKNIEWHVAHWFVRLPSGEAEQLPLLRPDGRREVMTGTLRWRPVADLLPYYWQLGFLRPLADVFEAMADSHENR